MKVKSFGAVLAGVGGVCAVLIGCGGSSGTSMAERPVGPPSALEMQLDSASTSMSLLPGLSTAVKGPVVTAGILNSTPFVSVGKHQYSLVASVPDAQIVGVNAECAAGLMQTGSFIWPYRHTDTPLNLPGEFITALAKTANYFLSSKPFRSEMELISLVGNGVTRSPIILPPMNSGNQTVVGVAVSDSGSAVIQVVPLGSSLASQVIRKHSVHPSGTVAERAAKFLMSASGSKGSFYLVSPSSKPVALSLPVGTFAMQITGLNNRGIAVGGAFTGDPSHPNLMPYYWDGSGTAYPMPVPPDVTLGFAQEINDQGLVVGGLGNDLTEFAAMWPTVASKPTNVNGLLSSTFPYDLTYVSSVGSDGTMAAEGFAKSDIRKPVSVAIQPQ